MYFLQMAYEVCHVSGCICVSGPARGRGGRPCVAGDAGRTKCASASAMRAHATARPSLPPSLPPGHDKHTAPPVYDGLLIIHTGGVCAVMPSDSPHMSVCVDQPLSTDSNEPVGWGGSERVPIQYYFHLVLSTCSLLECAC